MGMIDRGMMDKVDKKDNRAAEREDGGDGRTGKYVVRCNRVISFQPPSTLI